MRPTLRRSLLIALLLTPLIVAIPAVAAAAADDERAVALAYAAARATLPAGDFRVRSTTRSLTAVHVDLAQYIDGREVVGGGVFVTMRNDGAAESRVSAVRTVRPVVAQPSRRRAVDHAAPGENVLSRREVVYALGSDGVVAIEVISELPSHDVVASYFAVDDGSLLATHPVSFSSRRAAVFAENPVTLLNLPTLVDDNDSPTAVPSAAYSQVDLDAEVVNGVLTGTSATVVDSFFPLTTRIDPNASLEFDRGDPRFEEVMTYFHIDRSKKRLQSLGYVRALEILRRAVVADAHGTTDDRSVYTAFPPGRGMLLFGDGGVDDAEDPDVINHELAHVIHDSIIPGVLSGPPSSEGRALAEGFADYWAFSMSYAGSRATGRDPFCIGDWDARCGNSVSEGCAHPPATDCLRRVDSSRTMADYVRDNGAGIEYANGEIWSSFLVSIFNALVAEHGVEEGRMLADRLVIESLFGMPANPTFATAVARIADTDVALNGGSNLEMICSSTLSSRIFTAFSSCRSEVPGFRVFYPGTARGVAIPDGGELVLSTTVTDTRAVEKIYVVVDIEHEHRGDLRLTLVDPLGRRFLLQERGRFDAGDDIKVTYGLDAMPVDSFDPLRTYPARGEWHLEVSDIAADDVGVVRDWGMLFEFSDQLQGPDGGILPRVHTYVITPGSSPAIGEVEADLYVTNLSSIRVPLLMTFRPAGATEEIPLRVELAPLVSTRMSDVGRRYFGNAGSGVLDIYSSGEVATDVRLVVERPEGKLGARVPRATSETITTRGEDPLHLIGLELGERRDVSIVLAEISGSAPLVVDLEFFSLSGVVERRRIDIVAGGIVTVPVPAIDITRAVATVTSPGGTLTAHTEARLPVSGDVSIIAAQRSLPARTLMVEAGRVDSADGRQWAVELVLSNTTRQPFLIPLRYFNASGVEREISVALQEGETRRLRDVASLFIGPTLSLGHFEVDVPAGVIADAQLRNSSDDTAVFEALAWRDAGSLMRSGDSARFSFADSGTSQRTNVGITEMEGAPVTATIIFASAQGVYLASYSVPLAAHGAIQIAAPAGASAVTVAVVSGEGAIAAGVSVIDRVTHDSAYTALPLRP